MVRPIFIATERSWFAQQLDAVPCSVSNFHHGLVASKDPCIVDCSGDLEPKRGRWAIVADRRGQCGAYPIRDFNLANSIAVKLSVLAIAGDER